MSPAGKKIFGAGSLSALSLQDCQGRLQYSRNLRMKLKLMCMLSGSSPSSHTQAAQPASDGQQEHGSAAESHASDSQPHAARSTIDLTNLKNLRHIPLWLSVTVRFRGRVITKVILHFCKAADDCASYALPTSPVKWHLAWDA